MWQALITFFWTWVHARARAAAKKHYHKTSARHARGHKERIQPWVPIARKVEVIVSGSELIVRHNLIRI